MRDQSFGWPALVAFALLLGCGGGSWCWAAEPVAFILCGGNGNGSDLNEFPGQVRFEDYAELAMRCGPRLKQAGLKRALLHNPGGHFALGWAPNPANAFDPDPLAKASKLGTDTRVMWINQWLLAEQAHLRYADREKLQAGHKLLRSKYDLDEVIYYLGDPADLRDAYRQGLDCVEPFLDCGAGASVAFDLVAGGDSRWKAGDDICRLFEEIRKRGHKVYVEPRLLKKHVDAGLGKYVDGTIAAPETDAAFKYDMEIQPGDAIRGPLEGFGTKEAPAGVTPMWADPQGINWTMPK